MLDAPPFSQPSFPNSPRSPPFFLDRWTSDLLPGPELPENIDNNCSMQLHHEFGHDLHPLRSVHHDRVAPHEDFPDLDPNDQSVNLNMSLGSDQNENLGSKTQAVDAHQSQNQPVVAAMPGADSKKESNKKGGTTRGTKRFVGVRQRPSGRWVAEIKDSTQKIRLWLGTFDSAEEAARAYDDAARALRGANTRTNFAPSPNASSEAAGSASKASYMLLQRVAGKSSYNSASSVHSESEPMMLRDSLPFQAQQHEKAPTIPGKIMNVDTSLGSDSSYYFKEGIYEALREKLSKTLNKFPPLPFQRNGSGRFSSNGSGDTSDIITKAVADVYGRASNPIAGVLARTRSLSGPSTYNADKTSAALSFTRSNIKPSFVVPSVSTDSYFVPQMHGVDINSAVDQKTTSLDSRERSHGTSSIENPMQDLSPTSIFTEGDHMRSANAPSSMMSGLAPSTTAAYISNFLPEFCNPHSSFELNQQAISSYNASSFNDGQCLPRSMSASSRLMTTPCSLPPAYKKCKLSPSRNIPPSFNASMYAPEEHRFLNDWSSELKHKAANRDTSPSGASPEQQPVSCSSFSEEAINEAHSEESLLEGSSDPSNQEIPWSFWDEVQICETTA